MTDANWYQSWRADSIHELREKNAALESRYGLGRFERFDFDIANAALSFSSKGRVGARCKIQVIGSTVTEKGDWLWAWANPSLPAVATAAAAATRQFGVEHGADELTEAHVQDGSITERAWMLCAVAARVAGALGTYRAPMAKGFLFVVLTQVESVN
jgi:hypothetical protein